MPGMSSGLCGEGRREEDVGKADMRHGRPPPPLHEAVGALSSSVSQRLKQPPCKKERFRRSFILTTIDSMTHHGHAGTLSMHGVYVFVHCACAYIYGFVFLQ